MKNNLVKNWEFVFLLAILIFTTVFSLINLTTRPMVLFDEGLNIEIAHNFLLFKKLDILTAPNVFSNIPYLVGTSGYPVTILLSAFFSVFGFGLTQARLYMALWMIITLLAVYFFAKKIFGKNKAMTSTALIAVFAPFYGLGLTVMGEVPAFLFFIMGLYFLIFPEKKNYTVCGMFFSLAAVAKPSLFLHLFPTFLLFLFLKDKQNFFSKLFKFILGAFPFTLLWIALAFPNPFSLNTWRAALLFYRFPFGANFSILENIPKNINMLFTHSTLIYFLPFFCAIVYWFLKEKGVDGTKKKFAVFFFIYGAFAFLYFLKSPGWLRYVLAVEFLIFIFIPPSFKFLSDYFLSGYRFKNWIFINALLLLAVIQLFQLFFFRSDFYSPYPEKVVKLINEKLALNKNYKVGVINTPEIAGLLDSSKKLHVLKAGGTIEQIGENPLSFKKENLPRLIVFRGRSKFLDGYQNVLNENYLLLKNLGGFNVYEFK